MWRPSDVRLGQLKLEGVELAAIERQSARTEEAWDDLGRHCVLVDCPEIRTRVRLVQDLAEAAGVTARGGGRVDGAVDGQPGAGVALELARTPGDRDVLSLRCGAGASGAGVALQLDVVLIAVRYELGDGRGGRLVGSRELEFLAVSGQGSEPTLMADAAQPR